MFYTFDGRISNGNIKDFIETWIFDSKFYIQALLRAGDIWTKSYEPNYTKFRTLVKNR